MSRRATNTLIYSLALVALVALVLTAAVNVANPFRGISQAVTGDSLPKK